MRMNNRFYLRPPQNRLLLHDLGRRRCPKSPHRTNARFLGLCEFPSSVLRRVGSRMWSVLAVGEHGPLLRTAEFCASSLTTNVKRRLPIPDDDGPEGKRIGM